MHIRCTAVPASSQDRGQTYVSVDYDRLEDTFRNLGATGSGVSARAERELREQADQLARELIRLRRELTDLHLLMLTPVSYTHLTLPTNREV